MFLSLYMNSRARMCVRVFRISPPWNRPLRPWLRYPPRNRLRPVPQKRRLGKKCPPVRVMPGAGSTDTPADCECTLLIDGVVQKGRWVGGEWVTNKKR